MQSGGQAQPGPQVICPSLKLYFKNLSSPRNFHLQVQMMGEHFLMQAQLLTVQVAVDEADAFEEAEKGCELAEIGFEGLEAEVAFAQGCSCSQIDPFFLFSLIGLTLGCANTFSDALMTTSGVLNPGLLGFLVLVKTGLLQLAIIFPALALFGFGSDDLSSFFEFPGDFGVEAFSTLILLKSDCFSFGVCCLVLFLSFFDFSRLLGEIKSMISKTVSFRFTTGDLSVFSFSGFLFSLYGTLFPDLKPVYMVSNNGCKNFSLPRSACRCSDFEIFEAFQKVRESDILHFQQKSKSEIRNTHALSKPAFSMGWDGMGLTVGMEFPPL